MIKNFNDKYQELLKNIKNIKTENFQQTNSEKKTQNNLRNSIENINNKTNDVDIQEKALAKIFMKFAHKQIVPIISVFICLIVWLTIQNIYLPHKYSQFGEFFSNNTSGNIYKTIGMIIACWIIITILKYIIESIHAHLKPETWGFLRKLLINDIFNKSGEKNIDNGEYISRVLKLVDLIFNFFIDILEEITPSIIVMLITNIYFYTIDYRIGLCMTVCICILFLLIYMLGDKVYKIALNEAKQVHQRTVTVNDAVENVETIIVNNEVESFNKRIDKENESMYDLTSTVVKSTRDLKLYIDIVCVVTIMVLLFLSVSGVKNKRIDKNLMGSLIFVLILFIDYVVRLGNLLPDLIYNYGKLKESLSIFDLRKTYDNFYKHKDILTNYDIEFKNITVMRGNRKLFENFNLKIMEKENFGIFGKSGFGKSTLLKCLLKFVTPIKGKVLIGKQNIKDISNMELRNKVIFVGQNTTLLNMSILDNIKYGNNAPDDKIIKLLTDYKLFNTFKDGLDKMVELNGNNLSKGMQKVIFIVRGILRNGEIYLFDEPTTSLDNETKANIIKLIKEQTADKTVICVSHDEDIKTIMNRVIDIETKKFI